jgi:REP element-mobilizing transposase RayT
MPRGPRLDAPGVLQHVMVRGLERRALFRDDRDRVDFIKRLAAVCERTGLEVLAWALLPNHFHLLVRSPRLLSGQPSRPGLATAMRRLLTGYVGAFNRHHHRVGPLVQGRYKSILVEEEPYLLELVRYLHLNPLRAGVVEDLASLDRYAWTGHSALMGRVSCPWQAVGDVLEQFGDTPREARRRYRRFVAEGIAWGRRPELQGGGLRRSAGGWEAVAALRRGRERWAADERILGSGPFVKRVLEELIPRKPSWSRAQAQTALPELVRRCAAIWGVDPGEVLGGGRRRAAAHARAAASAVAVSHLGLSAASVARFLGVTPAVALRGVQYGLRLLSMRRIDPTRVVPRPKKKVQKVPIVP